MENIKFAGGRKKLNQQEKNDYRNRFLKQTDIYDILPFGKTKINVK